MESKKYQVGSHMLGLDNCNDNDFLVLTDGDENDYHTYFIDGNDIKKASIEHFNNYINFKKPFHNPLTKELLKYLWLYQLDRDLIKQDFPIEFHVLDHREKFIEFLNFIVDNHKLNFSKDICAHLGEGTALPKMHYHIEYLLCILENSDVELTDEQKDRVQKIHDREMPIEYLETLRQRIKALK